MNRRPYVMANIALPIEVTPNNDYKLLKDRIKINFGFCADLPGPISAQDMEVVRRLFPSCSSPRRSPSPSPQVSPKVSPRPSHQVSRTPSPEPIIPEEETEVYTPRSIRSPSHSPPRTRPSTPEPEPELHQEPRQESRQEPSTVRALFLALSQKDKTHKPKNRMTFRKYPAKPNQKYTRRIYD